MSQQTRAPVRVKEEMEDETEVVMTRSESEQRMTYSGATSVGQQVIVKQMQTESHPLPVPSTSNHPSSPSSHLIKRNFNNDISSVMCRKQMKKSAECHCDECEGNVFVEGEDEEDDGELLLTETEDEKDELRQWVRVTDPGTPAYLPPEWEDSNDLQVTHLETDQLPSALQCSASNNLIGHIEANTSVTTPLDPAPDTCPLKTNSPESRQQAIPSISSYRCTVPGCARVYQTQVGLYRHQAVHSGRFTCEQCGKSCSTNTVLKLHHLTHTTEKPHQCSQCQRAFAQKSALTQHQRTHSGEKPFQCTQCDKSFTQSGTLTGHLRVHTGDRPYKCTYCSFASAHKNNLTTHLRLHSGQLPFQCEQCSKRFNMKQHLTRHMRSKH